MGRVTAPQGDQADIAFEFLPNPDGGLGFRLSFPAMFVAGANLGLPVEAKGHGAYAITPAFAIQLTLDGDALRGTFAPGKLPLELRRGGELPAPLPAVSAPAGPAPVWTHALDAGTWASPVAHDGVVYVGDSSGAMHAVDGETGSSRWKWTGGVAIDGAVAVATNAVYFLDTRYQLVALDRAQGSLQWRVPLHDATIAGAPLPDNPTFNHRAATPLLADGVVYIGSSDGGLYAIDAATGAKRWRWDAGAPVYSSVTEDHQGHLMFGTMDGSVVLLDRHGPTEVARFSTSGGVVTAPLEVDGLVVAGSRDYQIHAFDLVTKKAAWRHAYWFSWIESTPALRDGLLYVGGSDYARVTAIEPRTGRARWCTIVGGMDWGTPLVTDDAVYIGTVNQNLPGTLIAHAAGLVKLDRVTGHMAWRIVLPNAASGKFAGFAGSLTTVGDKVIAAGFDGSLRAFSAR